MAERDEGSPEKPGPFAALGGAIYAKADFGEAGRGDDGLLLLTEADILAVLAADGEESPPDAQGDEAAPVRPSSDDLTTDEWLALECRALAEEALLRARSLDETLAYVQRRCDAIEAAA